MERWMTYVLAADIESVPGIGPVEAAKLAQNDDGYGAVKNTYQLLGKWLLYHEAESEGSDLFTMDTNEKFNYFLVAKGIDDDEQRFSIVNAVFQYLESLMPCLDR
jgi:hypothetical protein